MLIRTRDIIINRSFNILKHYLIINFKYDMILLHENVVVVIVIIITIIILIKHKKCLLFQFKIDFYITYDLYNFITYFL